MSVLVVADSMIMRKVVADALRSFSDAQPVEAGTAEEAFAILRSNGGSDVALALLDWYLPKMSGLDMLKLMQADRRLSKVPVVMVTSESAKQKVIACLRAGASGYIVKPFTQQVFRKKVAPFLEAGAASPVESPGGKLAGSLEQTSPLEVIQLISVTRKTGMLELRGPNAVFRLYFKEGELDHADGGGRIGEKAVAGASALSRGQFTFQTEVPEHKITIRRATDMIMLQAFREATDAGG